MNWGDKKGRISIRRSRLFARLSVRSISDLHKPKPDTVESELAELRPRFWVEVDLRALVNNYRVLKERVPGTFFAVIKKDAYGHGALHCARALAAEGAEYFAVATLEEALELRSGGIDTPILVFAVPDETEADEAVAADLTLTVTSGANIEAVGRAAEALGKAAKIHLKVDTGMTRVGWPAENQADALGAIKRYPSLDLEGVYSHLADSENDAPRSLAQAKQLEDFTHALANTIGHVPRIVHLANSAGTLIPECAFTGARVGIALYGGSELFPETRPVMTARSRIVQVRDVPAGAEISYGATFKAERPMKIGVVAAGYGDGMLRSSSGRGTVAIQGNKAPVVGRVCMDQFMVDLAGTENVRVGDPVLLFGEDSDVRLPAYEVAAAADTISYELLTLVGRICPNRRWIDDASG